MSDEIDKFVRDPAYHYDRGGVRFQAGPWKWRMAIADGIEAYFAADGGLVMMTINLKEVREAFDLPASSS